MSKHSKAYQAYQVFKYSIYILLCYNLYVFFMDDLSASLQTYPNGIQLAEFVVAYSTTIDTASWIILLLIFELETYIIEDENISGFNRWLMNVIKAVAYLFIAYSAFGYLAKTLFIMDYVPVVFDDVCALVGSSYTYVADLDDYLPITQEVCAQLTNQALYQIHGTQIIGTVDALNSAVMLAWTDVVNAMTWLVIVAILEVDVILQLKGKFTGKAFKFSQIAKMVLYGILFACAVYWGFNGEFIDFWDAFLWLLAFFFIEMNIFEWHKETEQHQHVST